MNRRLPKWPLLLALCLTGIAIHAPLQGADAAGQDEPESQYKLGLQYEDGQGVEKDLSLAATWYAKAAEQDYPAAQYRLGFLYYRGEGVAQDFRTAKSWLEKASVNDDADAALLLGRMYLDGSVEQDLVQSMTFNLKAAQQGKTAGMQAVCLVRFIAANGIQPAAAAIAAAERSENSVALVAAKAKSDQYRQVLAMVAENEARDFLNEAINLGSESARKYKLQQEPHLCTTVARPE
jgi:TPR repeat protein